MRKCRFGLNHQMKILWDVIGFHSHFCQRSWRCFFSCYKKTASLWVLPSSLNWCHVSKAFTSIRHKKYFFGFVAQEELGFNCILKKFGMIRNDVDYSKIYKYLSSLCLSYQVIILKFRNIKTHISPFWNKILGSINIFS